MLFRSFGGASEDEQTFGEKFEIVAKKYPKIFDVDWMTDRSLLFEYVAPNNVVVVRYKEEDLIFLGFVEHDTLEIGRWEEIVSIAKEANFNLVRLHNLPREPIQLLEEIKYWKDEGVVVRCCDDQVFVKVKSAYYLANHRMKYSITYEMINELLDSLGIVGGGQEERFKDELRKCEYDWEIIESALDFYNRYVKSYDYVQGILNEAKRLFEEWGFKNNVVLWNSESNKRKE